MPIEFDDPFAYDDYEDCISQCNLNAETCIELCSWYEEDEYDEMGP